MTNAHQTTAPRSPILDPWFAVTGFVPVLVTVSWCYAVRGTSGRVLPCLVCSYCFHDVTCLSCRQHTRGTTYHALYACRWHDAARAHLPCLPQRYHLPTPRCCAMPPAAFHPTLPNLTPYQRSSPPTTHPPATPYWFGSSLRAAPRARAYICLPRNPIHFFYTTYAHMLPYTAPLCATLLPRLARHCHACAPAPRTQYAYPHYRTHTPAVGGGCLPPRTATTPHPTPPPRLPHYPPPPTTPLVELGRRAAAHSG